LDGMDCMVKLTDDADVVLLEGDEYLSSPIDRRPKFHLYKPHIAIITGIAWDHINVFPTYADYIKQFEIFVDLIEPQGKLIFYSEDEELQKLKEQRKDISVMPYKGFQTKPSGGQTEILWEGQTYKSLLFGEHNMANLNGAMEVCRELGIKPEAFFEAIKDFAGAAKRLEKVTETGLSVFYKDFAHAPSKLKATTTALKHQYPERQLIACMELHTFSSLNKEFLPQYRDSMASADRALVYFSPAVVEHKKLEHLSPEEVRHAFAGDNVEVYTDSGELQNQLEKIDWPRKNLLMMSSGNFDGIDFTELGARLFT